MFIYYHTKKENLLNLQIMLLNQLQKNPCGQTQEASNIFKRKLDYHVLTNDILVSFIKIIVLYY